MTVVSAMEAAMTVAINSTLMHTSSGTLRSRL